MQSHLRLIRFGCVSQNQILSSAVIIATTKIVSLKPSQRELLESIFLNAFPLIPRSLLDVLLLELATHFPHST